MIPVPLESQGGRLRAGRGELPVHAGAFGPGEVDSGRGFILVGGGMDDRLRRFAFIQGRLASNEFPLNQPVELVESLAASTDVPGAHEGRTIHHEISEPNVPCREAGGGEGACDGGEPHATARPGSPGDGAEHTGGPLHLVKLEPHNPAQLLIAVRRPFGDEPEFDPPTERLPELVPDLVRDVAEEAAGRCVSAKAALWSEIERHQYRIAFRH